MSHPSGPERDRDRPPTSVSASERELELGRNRLVPSARPDESDRPARPLALPRLFLREPGWQVAVKVGSERTFCYLTHPGETYYHRLADGELYLYRADIKVCLPCADRQGLLHHEPKRLRPPARDAIAGPASAAARDEPGVEYALREDRDRPLSDGAHEDSFRPPRR